MTCSDRGGWIRWILAMQVVWPGACGSLPTIHPDLARHTGRVQADGARGPLTAAQAQAVIDRLKAGGRETSIFDRHLAFEEAVAGSPLVAGNKVTLLVDGPHTYRSMFSAIEGARDHINMESYLFEDDEVGHQFANMLIDKQRAGVQVNLIHDSVGTLGTPKAFFQQLKDVGVKVLEFNPVNPLRAKAGQEVNAAVLGGEFGQQMRELFERDIAVSKPITLEDWRRRGLRHRVREVLGKLWEYWL